VTALSGLCVCINIAAGEEAACVVNLCWHSFKTLFNPWDWNSEICTHEWSCPWNCWHKIWTI